ncbi:MAG TPA: helix-turn-helix domain-containing protein, partial [Candidatus Methylomirabilis sp.]|nr:helix-turn-helix domain-containing protein [Candidatus Methylomirabilis sp.]
LLIDDDSSIIESLSAALSPPYRVSAASDGKSALAFLETERSDLIILDLVLGREDGLELMPLVRTLTHAPILLLTGFGTRDNLLRVIGARPDGFLEKPIQLKELRDRVAGCLMEQPEADPLERVRVWIAREFHRPLTTRDLARAAGMGLASFRQAFARRFDRTPRAYLEQCRMELAAGLLRDTDLSVKEVAIQVGFSDGNNFSTAFKRYHGLSPEAFRARCRLTSGVKGTNPPSDGQIQFQR